MDTEVMLTTFDNPHDPFDDFVSWWMFDIEHGYNTCGKLARIGNWSDEMSTVEDKAETERAIDEIIDYDFLNIYKKAVRNVNNDEEEKQTEVVESEG